MDCTKVGQLIAKVRKEKGMTQQILADQLHVSDRAISKWERGMGCPDVSLLRALSTILGIDIEKLLSGELASNDLDGGNMKKIKFYVCPSCQNISWCTGAAEVSCCGKRLAPLSARPIDSQHEVKMEEIESDFYMTVQHEMNKRQYISFVAYVCLDRVFIMKLYPEQAAEVRFPQMHGGEIYLYCTEHGLLKKGRTSV